MQETSFFSYLIFGGSNGSRTAVSAFIRSVKCALSASLYIILVIENREGFRDCSFPHLVAHIDSFRFSPLVSSFCSSPSDHLNK